MSGWVVVGVGVLLVSSLSLIITGVICLLGGVFTTWGSSFQSQKSVFYLVALSFRRESKQLHHPSFIIKTEERS